MTTERFDDREIRALLGDLYLGSPEYTADAVRQATRARQRPVWTFIERWIPVSTVTLQRVPVRPFPLRPLAIVIVVGLLVALAAAAIVGSRPALPPPFGPAANGLVVYETAGDINVVDPTTGAARPVVGGFAADSHPRWSRDGTVIAFLRSQSGAISIAAVKADGTDLVVATERFTDVDSDSIAWSPDGRTVALSGSRTGGGGIFLFDAVDGSLRRLPVDRYLGLQVLWRPPDGRELLFHGREPGVRSGLYLINVADGSIRKVPTGDRVVDEHRPTGWTPDGRRVLYHADDATYVVDVETGAATALPIGVAQPSNDGTRVAGYSGSETDRRLCVMPIGGGECVVVASGDDVPEPTTHMGLQWLPDDEWILSNPASGSPAVLIDPSGGGTQRPTWLPRTVGTIQRVAVP